MRYLIKFSYDGTLFKGFQRQKDVKSVQGTLESVLSKYFNEEILIKGTGRTDAGVHAINQGAHFDVDKKITSNDLALINESLKGEIIINKIKRVPDDFHARFNAVEKTYTYKIYLGHDSSKVGYYYQINYDLDSRKMKGVAKLLEGSHDYHNFVSGDRDDYHSTIFSIKIKKKKNIILITFKGVGFYRYMVRHLVGAILDVGRGKASIEDVKNMLNNPNISKNLSVVPANGLYLIDIKYVF